VRYISMITVQALFFVSPVMLDRRILEAPGLEVLSYVNPMVPLLDLFRDPALYGRAWDLNDLWLTALWTMALWALALIAAARAGRRLIFAL
jgi:ABC-type polysaccharide/polyol phosphate export permease